MSQNNFFIDWNSRFSTQAAWTKSLREYLSAQLEINRFSKILEVGCGTGVILRETTPLNQCEAVGVDIDFSRLQIAKKHKADQLATCADVFDLPFVNNSFDFIVFHYFLLWINDPIKALQAIYKALLPGGIAIAFAEPDYKSRIEYPLIFEKFGKLQTKSLIQQGASVDIGRRLPEIFSVAGFSEIQYGVAGFQKPASYPSDDWDSEWMILEKDLKYIHSEEDPQKYQEMDKASRLNGTRVSWIPTFYAYGTKPLNRK